jgi:PAS domain S-box-containing protein
MSDAFFACDADGRIIYVNVEAEGILGPAPPLLGHMLWDAVPERTFSDWEGLFRRAMAGTTPIDYEEKLRPSGYWYRVRLVPVPNGILVFLVRRTERMRAEQAAAERSARVTELMDALAKASHRT